MAIRCSAYLVSSSSTWLVDREASSTPAFSTTEVTSACSLKVTSTSAVLVEATSTLEVTATPALEVVASSFTENSAGIADDMDNCCARTDNRGAGEEDCCTSTGNCCTTTDSFGIDKDNCCARGDNSLTGVDTRCTCACNRGICIGEVATGEECRGSETVDDKREDAVTDFLEADCDC